MRRDTNLAALAQGAYEKRRRLVAPLVGFPGVELVGNTIKLAQQNYGEHYRVIERLVERFEPDVVFPLMDLSVEANALGRYTIFPREESATVPKESFRFEELERLAAIDITMDTRVNGYVETLKLMKTGLPGDVLRGAYITGPYTLAGLVMGADEAAMATITAPDDLQRLVDVASDQIQSYVRMLIAAGAQVITVLEPTAVMLGPQQFRAFSTAYVSRIAHLARASGAQTVYHTCGNTMHLVEAMVDAGVDGLSLDAPQAGVDLAAAAERTPADVVVMGNLDPTGTLLRGTPGQVQREVKELQSRMAPYPNFILSTGCDLPQETPLENVDAFMAAGRNPIAASARFDVAMPVPVPAD